MFDTLLSVGANLLGGAMGADAAEDAARIQGDATAGATAEQRRQFDLIRSDQAPYRRAGDSSLRMLESLLGLGPAPSAAQMGRDPEVLRAELLSLEQQRDANKDASGKYDPVFDRAIADTQAALSQTDGTGHPYGSLTKKFTVDDFWADPVTKLSYQFGLDEGKKALYNLSPLTTGRDSGAALKELTKFATDYTGTRAGESYNRFENDKTSLFNKLAGIAGIGQTAGNTVATAGMSTGNNIANLMSAQGNAQGAARIAGANAWGGSLQNINNWWQQNQLIDKLRTPQTPVWSTPPIASSIGGWSATPYAGGYGWGNV